jgi:hypothetical protein
MIKALLALLIVLIAIPMIGALHWRSASTLLAEQVVSAAQPPLSDVETRCSGCLPDPVRRYFAATLRPGQPQIRAVELHQTGQFLLNGKWRPMRARQRFSVNPPAMLWDASISMAPMVAVRVRDGYVRGEAMMHAEFAALYPIVDQRGGRELNEGALQRYLGEAAWFPTALLPGPNVAWTPNDATSAIVTLRDGSTTASLRYTFDEDGRITQVYSPARYREVNGKYVPTPWRARMLAYGEHDGLRMPTALEVEWLLPEGPLPYWRGRIADIRFSY